MIDHLLGGGSAGSVVINGVTAYTVPTNGGWDIQMSFIVPDGQTYRFNGGSGTKAIASWSELR